MVHSDSEAESLVSQHSETSATSFSQQFEPQEDDEETLWEVEKITAEKPNQYKVKWKGIDPKTLKPWTQSWVPKKDCTPDLVIEWKKQKKEKESRKSTASKRGRNSTASKKSGRTTAASVGISKISTSKLSGGRRSVSTVNARANDEITTARRGRSSATSTRTTATATPSKNLRRSKSAVNSNPDIASQSEEESPPPKTNTKGKKRKLAEADSAHNSANVPIDVNVNKDGDAVERRVVPRPNKKRKIEIETIKPEPEDEGEQRRSLSISQTQSQSQPQVTQDEESYEVRKSRGKVAVAEEEEEERMVEDALSQGFNSPTPILDAGDELEEDQKPSVNKGKGRELEEMDESEVDELEEDSVIIISQPSNIKPKKNPVNGKSTAKSLTVSTKASANPKTKAKSTTKSKIKVVPGPSKSTFLLSPPPKFGPPPRKSLINTKTTSSNVPPLAPPSTTTPKKKSTTTAMKYPRIKAMQTSTANRHIKRPTPTPESGSDTDSGPPPLVWSAPRSSQRPPTEEHSIFWPGDSEVSVRLSPRALERLRIFDEEVLNAPGPSTRTKAPLQEVDEAAAPSRESVEEQQEQPKEKQGAHGGHELLEVVDLVPHDGMAVPSSKTAQKRKTSVDSKAESEKDQDRVTENRMFWPNKSSALMMASTSKLPEAKPNEQVIVDSPPVAADLGIEARSMNRKPSKEPTQPAHGSKATTPKPKPTSSSSVVTTNSNGNHRQRSAKPPNNIEIVPETEEEQSQSQPIDLDLPAPIPTSYLTYPQPPTTPGDRSTLRSRMKPRTPLSRSSSTTGRKLGERPLGPIPELLPSIFHPHLPEPISSLPESITDAPTSDNKKNEDATMSSIEDFDSPEKDRKPKGGKKIVVTREDLIPGKDKQKEPSEDVWESDVVKRGQEIAEAAKRNSETQLNAPAQRPKKTLDDIRASRSRSGSNVSQVQRGFDLAHDKIAEEDEMQDVSTAVVPPASGPRATLDENITLHEMEEAYVDLSGGTRDDHTHGANAPDHMALRQEEEESTQDLMMDIPERGVDIDLEGSRDIRPPNAVVTKSVVEDESNKGTTTSKEGSSNDLEVPKIVVQDASQSGSSRPYSSEEGSHIGHMRTTRSRSRSQTPSVASQATKSKDKMAKIDVSLKKSSRAGSVAPSIQISLSPNDHHGQSNSDIQERLNTVLALVDAKSNDIARLEAELASQKVKTEELQVKIDFDHQAMQEAVNSMGEEVARSKEGLEQKVTESERKCSELLAEKLEWEVERALLVADVESAGQSKLSADKDRDFFREQYAQASGFVSSVRDENKDLEKRIKIAEEQAKSGVALIKSTFELRVKALENDAKSWRKMAEFMMEKDRRTDNDDIRRRAAEQPELRSHCVRQERELDAFRERVEELEAEVEQKERGWSDSKAELQKWKKELTTMHIELTEATTKLERIGLDGNTARGTDTDDNGHEFVYCCQWRTHDGTESTACRAVFSTMSGLEEHLLTGGHLDT